MAIDFVGILKAAVQKGASDIHILVGKPPMLRVLGEIVPLDGAPVLKPEDTQPLIYSILFDQQRRKFEEKQELDCSFAVPGVARFRQSRLRPGRVRRKVTTVCTRK